MKNKYLYFLIGILLAGLGSYGMYIGLTSDTTLQKPETPPKVVRVVAAENFYGDVVKQLGGNHIQVVSILSDPNADPHEYESSVQDAIAVAKADLVIRNGGGYDTWIDKLLSASPNRGRVVITGVEASTHTIEDNPHMWYGIDNVSDIAGKITESLKQKDSADANEFDRNLTAFNTSLQPLEKKMSDIKAKYNNTPVGLTETMYLYQTEPEGLTVLTPYAFERAIAEGNDPSVDDVIKTNDQVTKKQIKVLIYNEQTITPMTTNLLNTAEQHGIPVVPVTETMPVTKHYQTWMMDQLIHLERALQKST